MGELRRGKKIKSGFLADDLGLGLLDFLFECFQNLLREKMVEQLFVFELVNVIGEVFHGYKLTRNDGEIQQ